MADKLIQKTFEFDIVSKLENYSSTVDELRTGIFAPVKLISPNSVTYKSFLENKNVRIIENSWGKVELRNRILTQIHRDIIDAILSVQDDSKKVAEGVEIYFTTSKVLKKLKHKNLKNHKWLNDKIKEVADLVVFITKDGEGRSFSIFRDYDDSSSKGLNKVVFTNRYLKFFDETLLINYKDELDKLLEIDSGLLKAIIRFFWTHSSPKFSISIQGEENKKGLLETIGFPVDSPRTLQTAKKEIRDNKELLKEYGIIYEEDKKNKISYLKSSFDNNINFLNGKKTSLLSLIGKEIIEPNSQINFTISSINKSKQGYIIQTLSGEIIEVNTNNEKDFIEQIKKLSKNEVL